MEKEDKCKTCVNNKPGIEAGYFCITNCINGTRYKDTLDKLYSIEQIEKAIDESDIYGDKVYLKQAIINNLTK